MRLRSEIKKQLRQVTYRHLQKLLRDNFKKKPQTCAHNTRCVVEGNDTAVYVCGYIKPGGHPRNVLCDRRVPGCLDMARQCDLWSPAMSKDDIKDRFHGMVQSGDRGLIASKYPDIAALMWVLDGDSDLPSEEEVNAEVAEPSGPVVTPSDGWGEEGD